MQNNCTRTSRRRACAAGSRRKTWIGDKVWDRLDQSIRLHDKLLLVLSANSIGSEWVEDEVTTAFEEERRRGRAVLFPVRVDETVFDTQRILGSQSAPTQYRRLPSLKDAFTRRRSTGCSATSRPGTAGLSGASLRFDKSARLFYCRSNRATNDHPLALRPQRELFSLLDHSEAGTVGGKATPYDVATQSHGQAAQDMYPREFLDSYWHPALRDVVFVVMPFHSEFTRVWEDAIRPTVEHDLRPPLSSSVRVDVSTLSREYRH